MVEVLEAEMSDEERLLIAALDATYEALEVSGREIRGVPAELIEEEKDE
jgi:hypothetical protein